MQSLDRPEPDEFEVPDQALSAGSTRSGQPDTRLSVSMKTRDAFYSRVTEAARSRVSPDLQAFTARPMFNIMKVAYANERVHYEVVLDVTRRLLEIGLHFEDGPASTIQYLRLLDSRIVELKDELGAEIELERWTQSWGRIYELWPLDAVDSSLAERVGARLAAYITTLQPILDRSGIKAERAMAKGERR